MILAFLTSRLGSLLSAGLAVVLGLALAVSAFQIHSLKGQLAHTEAARKVAVASLNTCHGNVSTLEAARKAQNEAVEALRVEGETRVAESRKAASDARKVAESYRRSAASILSAKPRGGDACSSADALIAEVAR